ncbi:MAG TPA: FHA domain-containing protein, partial [Paraburkholderia sp.]|nr:FHA domain-containing protein [Paraburkholderia sp.]
GADGKTLLYDAIVKAINRLREDPAVKSGRVLVISDGKDEGSSISLENLSGIAHDRGFRIDSIGYGAAAPQSSSSLKTLSTATGGTFVLAETSGQLADAVSDDLGVAPLPAFNVQFAYGSSESAAHTDKAQLRYAVAGADAVTVPLNKAVSLPSPPAPMPQASAASETNAANGAADDVVAGQSSFMDRLKKFWAAASDRMKIAIGAAGVALLALIAWLVIALRRPDREVEETRAPDSDPVPPRLAPTQIGPIFPAPAMGRPAALLVEIGGRHPGKPYAIEQPLVRIGAEPDNDMFVDDEFMSRRHAAIRYEAGSLYLSDVGSTNGTFLNGVRLAQTPRLLAPGDEIRFGRTSFQLRGADHDTDDRRRRARTKVP